MKKLAVLGAGSWGTALALNSARCKDVHVTLWAHRESHAKKLISEKENTRYLPGCKFPDNLKVTSDIEFIKDVDAILIVVPSMVFSDTLLKIKPYINKQSIGWAIKGFDKKKHCLLSDTYQNILQRNDYAIVAGPSFAKEVAKRKPTALAVSSLSSDFMKNYAGYLNNNDVVIYLTDDVVATQVGGALKNVVAIATGISDGLGLGANARSALITRGLHEISRFGISLGGRRETFMGLSGLGDLVLTCTDNQSRNRQFGCLIGKGISIDDALDEVGQTVEGIHTTHDCIIMAERLDIRMPVTKMTQRILKKELSVNEAMRVLLDSAPKKELN